MKLKVNSFIIFILLLSTICTFGQIDNNKKLRNLETEPSKRISIYTEPVEGVYKNFWYGYKLDNREIAIISEGKTKEIRSIILFNCNNDKYEIYASTNFGHNITEEVFKNIVPVEVIDLSRTIMCAD